MVIAICIVGDERTSAAWLSSTFRNPGKTLLGLIYTYSWRRFPIAHLLFNISWMPSVVSSLFCYGSFTTNKPEIGSIDHNPRKLF